MNKLTQEEIFQALLDKKKIRQSCWKEGYYIHFVNGVIVDRSNWRLPKIEFDEDWELYMPPTVTFFEALEAMKEGKRVKGPGSGYFIYFNTNTKKLVSESKGMSARTYEVKKSDLDDKWQILEGEENE